MGVVSRLRLQRKTRRGNSPIQIEDERADFITVASYNIHRGVGIDRRPDLERIAEVIRELDADVIGLQEIDVQYFRKSKVDQVDYLSKATGFNVLLGPTRKREDGHYGNAVLTNHRIIQKRQINFSVPGREPRGAIDVDLEIKEKRVRLIVAHLGLGIFERRFQVKRLRESFSSQCGHFEIMVGDINEWFPKGSPLRQLHDYFGRSPGRRTFPSCFPVLALDRIWVRPADALVEMDVHVSPLSRFASDHLPLKATIALSNGTAMKAANSEQ